MAKQKFKRFSIVKVDDEMPEEMSHFEKGFLGIVEGTYNQLYGGGDIQQYSLYQLDRKGKKVINTISWYDEEQLTLVETPSIKTVKLVDKYLDSGVMEYGSF
jgi:hypothetical protein